MTPKQLSTLKSFMFLSEQSIELLKTRNEIKSKLERTFTRVEASEFLKCDTRTLKRYTTELDLNPEAYKEDGIAYLLTMSELYQIRDIMAETTLLKRKVKQFKRSENQTCQKIVIQNQKGGVAKTLTTLVLGSGVAAEYHEEYRVCLLDLDGQSTLSMYYPRKNDENEKQEFPTIGDLMLMDSKSYGYEETVLQSVSDTSIPNLKIIPASQGDRDIESAFHIGMTTGTIESPYTRLNDVISVLESQFDLIIIDTPPSLGFASLNAYYAASSVIFPMPANQNDFDATCQYFSYIPKVFEAMIGQGHQGYDFIKLLITNYEESTSTLEILSEVTQQFPNYVMTNQFKKSEAIRECSKELNSIFDISKSEYSGRTKKPFDAAKINAKSVVEEVMNQVRLVWNKQDIKLVASKEELSA